MSPSAAARQPKSPPATALALLAALPLAMALIAPVARAEPQTALLLVEPAGADPAPWARRLRDLGLLAAPPVLDVEAWAAGLPAAVSRERLQGLATIETLLAEARVRAAALQEAEALASLARASELAGELGDVPGAAAWNAEIQLRLAAIAAQSGLSELAEVALARAASLDPARALEPAEAPPSVVALAEQVRARVAGAAEATLPVQVDARGARVFLDDVDRGLSPVELRLRAGRHVLRVEAPGHRPFGRVLDVLPGRRPPLRPLLSPDPARALAAPLPAAARRGDFAALAAGLAALRAAGAPLSVLVVHADRAGRRAAVVRCDASGCGGPLRLDGATPEPRPERELARPLTPGRLRAARAWLASGEPSHPRTRVQDGGSGPWWLLVAGLSAAAAVSALVLATEDEAPPARRIVVDPTPLAE